MRIETVLTSLAITALTISSQGATRQLVALITPEKPTVQLGEPIKVSLTVTNQGPNDVQMSRTATAFGCFKVTDPDGQILPYIGFDGQVAANPIDLKPAATFTIADALDLTDKYLFQKPGKYSIRFTGEWTGIIDSPAIAIEVKPGRLSEFDQVVALLLPICANGWHLAKDSRTEAAPFGRSRVPGFALHLCHNHMRAEAVYLWFTKVAAELDPTQQSRLKSDYVGRVRSLYVYGTVGENTPALWPTAMEEVSRALEIGR